MSNYLIRLGFKLRNLSSLLRAYAVLLAARGANMVGVVTMVGVLEATLIKADGTRIDLGILGARSVTDAGVAYLVDDWDGGANDFSLFNFHDSGTGGTAESVADVGMQTPAGPARVSGTKSQPAANQARTVATITYTATLAIVEHGIFSASTGVTLWDRTVFGTINVDNTDSIQFTYTLTINSGG